MTDLRESLLLGAIEDALSSSVVLWTSRDIYEAAHRYAKQVDVSGEHRDHLQDRAEGYRFDLGAPMRFALAGHRRNIRAQLAHHVADLLEDWAADLRNVGHRADLSRRRQDRLGTVAR